MFWCGSVCASDVFRQPFDLHVGIDKERQHKQNFDLMPYVAFDSAYLFYSDIFGIRITLKTDSAIYVDYEPELSKADLVFNFSPRPANKDALMILLTIENRTDKTIHREGYLTVPGEKDIFSNYHSRCSSKSDQF